MRLLTSLLIASICAIPALGDNLSVSGTHALGNGHVCAYGKDADIPSIFGPTYSSPTIASITLDGVYGIESYPEKSGGVWNIVLSKDGSKVGTIRDCIPPKKNVLVREIIPTGEPIVFSVSLLPENRALLDHMSVEPAKIKGSSSAFIVRVKKGVPFYSAYASPSEYHAAIFSTGKARLDLKESGTDLSMAAEGKGAVYVVIADSPEALDNELKGIRCLRPGKAVRQSRRQSKRLRGELPAIGNEVLSQEDKKDLENTLNLVSDYVLAQQDAGGGILAGKNYHMAYVRDQYGNSRGLLAMGHLGRAKDLLDFYFRIWEKFGLIHNAQPMGVDGAFHCHEDDNTEITGYLVTQAMDYYRQSGDKAFVNRIMPTLRWAVQAQQADIIDGMLPFNGDETYIAGGILPRDVMYHGSAEATLLFIESTRNLVEYLAANPSDVWTKEEIDSAANDADLCAKAFRDNFFVDGKLFINNPEREKKVVYPATRPGVCLYPGVPTAHYPVTYHFKGNLYFCEDCMKKDTTGIVPPTPRRFSIPSAFLFPIYIDAKLFTDNEKKALLEEVVDCYGKTGRLDERDIVLGYDYGLFLYALTEYDHPLAAEIYRKMMDLRDSSLSWVEYYVGGVPFNTPCRPWESSINIAAALKYANGHCGSSPGHGFLCPRNNPAGCYRNPDMAAKH